MYAIALALIVVAALLLVHYKPGAGTTEQFASRAGYRSTESFAVAAVHPVLMPACVERSIDAQKLLTRIATYPVGNESADELRLIVSKLCCMEADIATPAAGKYRTMPLQYRTSHDMEPASTLVGRCLANAMRDRDITLITDKFTDRGHALLNELLAGSCTEATAEFDAIVDHLRLSMTHFCLHPQPSMDKPIGARDLGFWESVESASLDQYKGISAAAS
jgi:hypothetical protein